MALISVIRLRDKSSSLGEGGLMRGIKIPQQDFALKMPGGAYSGLQLRSKFPLAYGFYGMRTQRSYQCGMCSHVLEHCRGTEQFSGCGLYGVAVFVDDRDNVS